MKIGQLCLKIAGRDGGNFCLIVDKIDNNYVLIDGNVRRKKCNIKHLEFTDKILKIKKSASSEEVRKALEQEGIKIIKKGEKRTTKQKITKKRKQKPIQEIKEEVKKPKEVKKEIKKKETKNV